MEDIQVTHLPRDERQATPIHGIGNAVSANTDHPEAAAAFLAFLGGERAAIIQAEAGTANPAYAGSQDAFVESRSEEHTSELQSRFDLVCRLLLDKK